MLIIKALYILAFAWLLIVLIYFLVPFAYGLPPTPTQRARVKRALELAKLKPGETLYDLGSGDGRVLVIAARDFGASATGIDVGPIQCLQAWLQSRLAGVGSRVRILWADFFKQDLSQADVVFAYLTSGYAAKLSAQLISQLKPGARVVTISFDFPEWEPTDFDDRQLIFLYRMPPVPGDLSTYLSKRTGS